MHYKFTIFLMFISWQALPTSADFYLQKLNKDQRSKVEAGELVLLQEKVKDATWNKLIYYKMIPVDFKTGMAIFTDYENHKSFVPNLIYSKIVKEYDKKKHDIKFELDLPWPVPNAEYVTTNELKVVDEQTLLVKWNQVESTSTEDSVGLCLMNRRGDKRSLLVYENFVMPKSIFASFFKSKAVSDTTATVKSIVVHLISEAARNGEYLTSRLGTFQKVLKE